MNPTLNGHRLQISQFFCKVTFHRAVFLNGYYHFKLLIPGHAFKVWSYYGLPNKTAKITLLLIFICAYLYFLCKYWLMFSCGGLCHHPWLGVFVCNNSFKSWRVVSNQNSFPHLILWKSHLHLILLLTQFTDQARLKGHYKQCYLLISRPIVSLSVHIHWKSVHSLLCLTIELDVMKSSPSFDITLSLSFSRPLSAADFHFPILPMCPDKFFLCRRELSWAFIVRLAPSPDR